MWAVAKKQKEERENRSLLWLEINDNLNSALGCLFLALNLYGPRKPPTEEALSSLEGKQ